MDLLVDIGATKGAWKLSGSAPLYTPPFNAATMAPSVLDGIVRDTVLPWLAGRSVRRVEFYGAGIISDTLRHSVVVSLRPLGASTVLVDSDMVGAARSLLGDTPGIACILGTGSNSCLYDGHRIVDNVPPLGYILGDEGSGAAIGKRFVGDLFKRQYPALVTDRWNQEISLPLPRVIERVYRCPGANTWLASLVPFIASVMHIPQVRDMLCDEFRRFFDRNICLYDTPSRQLGFIGGVAVGFSPLITAVAAQYGYRILAIKKSLIE